MRELFWGGVDKKGLWGERWFKPTSATEKSAQNSWSADFSPCYCCSVSKSCLTLLQTHGHSPPASSVHGISQARILKWIAISFPRGSSWLRDRTHVSGFGRQILYYWVTKETLAVTHTHEMISVLVLEETSGHVGEISIQYSSPSKLLTINGAHSPTWPSSF